MKRLEFSQAPRRRAASASSLRAARLALAGLALLAATGPVAAAPIEVRVARGLDGVVAAGGIDVAVVEVRSGADVPLAGTLSVAGRRHPVELPARGVAVVTVAARLPTGASALTSVPVRLELDPDVGTRTPPSIAALPAARVVPRPVVVISDAPAAALAALESWRRARPIGEPVVLSPGRVPALWQALVGAGALVVDRPAAELAPAVARAARRFLAAGGQVCRVGDDLPAPRCVQAPALAAPRTAVRATLAPVLGRWARLALLLGLGLALALVLRRHRRLVAAGVLVVGAAAPVVAAVREPASRVAMHGVRADAGGGEDWVAAELGAGDLHGVVELGGDLWVEASGVDGSGALDVVGLGGWLPGPGSWRVRGFVPATAGGWAARLERHPRVLPELP